MEMTAFEFKTKCLELMDEIQESHEEVTITKNGKAVARVVPADEVIVGSYGFLKDSVQINGDIIHPIDEKWSAEG